nr:MAG TPA: hypothetical protein [Inoviridae sp.]
MYLFFLWFYSKCWGNNNKLWLANCKMKMKE